jgi:hypothetical protein
MYRVIDYMSDLNSLEAMRNRIYHLLTKPLAEFHYPALVVNTVFRYMENTLIDG